MNEDPFSGVASELARLRTNLESDSKEAEAYHADLRKWDHHQQQQQQAARMDALNAKEEKLLLAQKQFQLDQQRQRLRWQYGDAQSSDSPKPSSGYPHSIPLSTFQSPDDKSDATKLMNQLNKKWIEVKSQHASVTEMQDRLEREARALAIRETRLQDEENAKRKRSSTEREKYRRMKQEITHFRKRNAELNENIKTVKSQRDDYKARCAHAVQRASSLKEQTSVLRQERNQLLKMIKKMKSKADLSGAATETIGSRKDQWNTSVRLSRSRHKTRPAGTHTSGVMLLSQVNKQKLVPTNMGSLDVVPEEIERKLLSLDNRMGRVEDDVRGHDFKEGTVGDDNTSDFEGTEVSTSGEQKFMSIEEHESHLAEERRKIESDAAAALMASENDMREEFRAEIELYREREIRAREEMATLKRVVASLLDARSDV